MQNYTLSREQSHALQVIKGNDLSCLLYLDKVNLASSIIEYLSSDLLEGKRSVLFLESDEIIQLIKEKIEGTSIEHLFLFLTSDDFLSEKALARIRTMAKEKIDSNNEYQHSIHQLGLKEKRILSAFGDAAEKIFGERRWRDLVLLPRRTDGVLNTLQYQIKLDLTQQEFWHIRGMIEEAKSLYDSSHLMSKSIASIFKVALDSEEVINDLKQKMVDFRKKLLKTILSLDSELENYKNRIHRKLEEEYLQVTKLIEVAWTKLELIQENESKEQGGSFTFFTNKKSATTKKYEELNEIRKEISNSILIQLPDLLQSEEKSYWKEQIHIWEEQLSKWKLNRDSITNKMIRSLNKNNSDTGGFKSIDLELTRLYKEINESEIFKDKIENTSLNTYQQYIYAENLLQQIRLAVTYLNENLEIIIWENFYNNLPRNVQQLLSALKKHDIKDWIPLYEKWYLDRLLEKHFNPDSMILNTLISDYLREYDVIKNSSGPYIDSLFHDSRIKSMDLAKNRSKELFQKIFKKKNIDDLRAFDIIWAEKEMLSNFFPVMVISSKLLRSNRLLNDGNWDQMYCERTEIFEHIEKYRLLEHKICFLSPLAESFKTCNDLNISLENKELLSKLLIHEYNFNETIEDLPISDRLRAAKKLSKILLSLNQNVRIFQMRNANIISILPMRLNQQLLEICDEAGIKEIIPDESLYESVTESIIATDRTHYLLYQDHLINIDQFEHFGWQIEAIQSFASGGFHLIHIDSVSLKQDLSHFEDLIKDSIKIGDNNDAEVLPKEA